MADHLPKFKPGQAVTWPITDDVVGGHLVSVAGAHTGADAGDYFGVASRDAAAGDRITLYKGGIQTLVASGAISAGDRVKCGAAGTVAVFTAATDDSDLRVGLALADAADGETVDVDLDR